MARQDWRFRRAFLTSSLTFLILVNLLGAVAVVNGLWSKTLIATGVIETGDLAARWESVVTNDSNGLDGSIISPDPCLPGNPDGCPEPPATRADIGSCEYVSGAGTAEAVVAIENAYGSYECTITGNIENHGSVPFNVIGVNLLLANGNDAGLEGLALSGVEEEPACSLVDDVDGAQIDPGATGAIQCRVHVKEEANPGWTYYFAIETCVAQWNEDPALGEPAPADFSACKNSLQHEGPGTPELPAPHATTGG